MFNGSGMNAAFITANVQQVLSNLRGALNDAQGLHGWSSGVSAADLQAAGFSAADAASLLSAIADANALAQIYSAGQPPASYPQAASAYVYAASQAAVIGP